MEIAFELLNYRINSFGILQFKCQLFTYLNDKLFSHELILLNHVELWEDKKIPDETQPFHWIKLID